MRQCPSYGRDVHDAFAFCGACGAPVPTDVMDHPARCEERKVVTVLFVDLVGFTTRAEQMDPEDVGSMLRGYHAQVARELRRFGGTVEKFIGDAVMAVFGTPTVFRWRHTPHCKTYPRWTRLGCWSGSGSTG